MAVDSGEVGLRDTSVAKAAWLCGLAFLLLAACPADRLQAQVQGAGGEGTAETQVFTVSTPADSGPGSLREAMEQAAESGQSARIVFGDSEGPFRTPQTIELSSPLPVIEGQVEIDGHIPGLLWKAYGATLRSAGDFRIFEVAPTGELRVAGITLENGKAEKGGAIFNRGRLVVDGVTLVENQAVDAGGAIANQGGVAHIVNSTAYDNHAARGGAVANLDGVVRLTHVTLHLNEAGTGSAIFSLGELSLSNSILTGEGTQCVHSGPGLEATHNIFTSGEGCGEAILSADPHLGELNYYNGPTRTIPISSLSPALNLGDNAAAVDAAGNPLKWDQRGNGDPRFARGYVDIGAFEHQTFLPSEYVVDTTGDIKLRGCTEIKDPDCPLRAAVELSLAGRHLVPVRFLSDVFTGPQVLRLDRLPPAADQPLVLDGEGTAGVTIIVPEAVPWSGVNGVRIEVAGSGARSGS